MPEGSSGDNSFDGSDDGTGDGKHLSTTRSERLFSKASSRGGETVKNETKASDVHDSWRRSDGRSR